MVVLKFKKRVKKSAVFCLPFYLFTDSQKYPAVIASCDITIKLVSMNALNNETFEKGYRIRFQ